MVASDPSLVEYMSKVLAQMKGAMVRYAKGTMRQAHTIITIIHIDWLLHSHLQKLVLVVASVASGEVLERWTFDVHADSNDRYYYVGGWTCGGWTCGGCQGMYMVCT